ncbi:hypothetical protein G9A89_011679 [Geosiphon pyriformis]|nr:hypothetical protein G9A89_011679 [Geosiphon pyriformis]
MAICCGLFQNISSAAAALIYWSVLVKKDSIRILPLVNQNNVISSRDAFKAKLVNLSFGCTAYEISELVSQVGGHTCFILCSLESYQRQCFAVVTFDSLKSLNIVVSKTGLDHLALKYKILPLLSPKVSSNFSGGSKVFKSSFAGSKSYAKTAVIMVPLVAAAADTNLDLSSPLLSTTTLRLPAAPSAFNIAVEARLAFLESHLGELSLLIKFLVEPVGALVALVTKLLSTSPAIDASVKECVNKLKRIIHLEKICEWACLKDGLDVDNMVDDIDNDDNNNKDFSV